MDMDSESIDQLVRSPLGAAFLMVAKESGLRPEEAAEPMNCLQIAAVASEWISVHRGGDYGRTKQHVLERGPEFVSFGRDIITAGDCAGGRRPPLGRCRSTARGRKMLPSPRRRTFAARNQPHVEPTGGSSTRRNPKAS